MKIKNNTLRRKCPYSEFFWSVFSPKAGKYEPEKRSDTWNKYRKTVDFTNMLIYFNAIMKQVVLMQN